MAPVRSRKNKNEPEGSRFFMSVGRSEVPMGLVDFPIQTGDVADAGFFGCRHNPGWIAGQRIGFVVDGNFQRERPSVTGDQPAKALRVNTHRSTYSNLGSPILRHRINLLRRETESSPFAAIKVVVAPFFSERRETLGVGHAGQTCRRIPSIAEGRRCSAPGDCPGVQVYPKRSFGWRPASADGYSGRWVLAGVSRYGVSGSCKRSWFRIPFSLAGATRNRNPPPNGRIRCSKMLQPFGV